MPRCLNMMMLFSLAVLTMSARLPAASREGAWLPADLSVAANGTFLRSCSHPGAKGHSLNGEYWCRYRLGRVGDEHRELLDFELFRDECRLYSLSSAPGSDLYISDRGLVAFLDHRHHARSEVTVNFLGPAGDPLFSKTFRGAFLFGFSPRGDQFAVGTTESLQMILPLEDRVSTYEKGVQFAISQDGQRVAVAAPHRVLVYSENQLIGEISTGLSHCRRVSISEDNQHLALIGKKQIQVYRLCDGGLVFADTSGEGRSFRDVLFWREILLTGLHQRRKGVSEGILLAYDLHGRVVGQRDTSRKNYQDFHVPERIGLCEAKGDSIPWPFFPFEEMHTIWNYYEQHMGGYGAAWSYLHQGLDIIVPIGEPVFAVADGVVKCVLTLGGDFYWRLATSREQTSEPSTGWLYAHLIPSSIQFDVGDTVRRHDYLGDIIQWAEDWGHIHFVEIQDSGLVWRYDDDEWGITHNPLLDLRPNTDLIPPIIEEVSQDSKLAFCRNETSQYLNSDSLYGPIDIIVKVKDYVGASAWEQPAFEIYYWLKSLFQGEIVFPRTLGQILNHPFDFYESEHYEPYATLLYKRDELLQPTSWMEPQRNFYHILTNNDGDSLALLSEKEMAFVTSQYPDGPYRFYVEARDEYGNVTIDSMDVFFRNSHVGVAGVSDIQPSDFSLAQNYPNPFNPVTVIDYSMARDGQVSLKVFDVLGREIETLVDGFQEAGAHRAIFPADDLASGVYLYRLQTEHGRQVKKMILLR